MAWSLYARFFWWEASMREDARLLPKPLDRVGLGAQKVNSSIGCWRRKETAACGGDATKNALHGMLLVSFAITRRQRRSYFSDFWESDSSNSGRHRCYSQHSPDVMTNQRELIVMKHCFDRGDEKFKLRSHSGEGRTQQEIFYSRFEALREREGHVSLVVVRLQCRQCRLWSCFHWRRGKAMAKGDSVGSKV